jgi:hypothetical protein
MEQTLHLPRQSLQFPERRKLERETNGSTHRKKREAVVMAVPNQIIIPFPEKSEFG